MIEYHDDMETDEVADEAKDKAFFVSDRIDEAEESVRAEWGNQEEAIDRLSMIVDLADKIRDFADRADYAIGESMEHGDDAVDKLQEAKDVTDTLPEFVEELASRAQGDTPSAAEAEVELDGTPYRIRIDPMEEVETEDIE